MIRFDWGNLQLTVLDGGSIRLDGGAMFGIVPKVLWQKERKPDERNRIHLAMNVLLVDDGRQLTLIDTGAGTHWDGKERDIFGLDTKSADQILAPAGVTPGQIDRVINSHLHFDHAGGNTLLDERGNWQPAFPNAEYVVQQGELRAARRQDERTRGSYRLHSFEPLVQEGRLRLVDGQVSLGNWLKLRPAPGHTAHMQIVLVVSEEGTVAFLADLVPTASHVPYPYIMGFDLEPLTTLATKKRLLPQAAAERWRVVFEHDDRLPVATLVEHGGRLVARPIELEA